VGARRVGWVAMTSGCSASGGDDACEVKSGTSIVSSCGLFYLEVEQLLWRRSFDILKLTRLLLHKYELGGLAALGGLKDLQQLCLQTSGCPTTGSPPPSATKPRTLALLRLRQVEGLFGEVEQHVRCIVELRDEPKV
jgi:hypothetical protein